jgi:hypothetical protein
MRKWWPAALFVFYLLFLRAYYVGFFNDDAFYVVGARSLLQGGYMELSSPVPRPLDNYPPGYPLLLAQVLWLFGGSLLAAQLLSVALSVASAWLLWKLSEDWRAVLAAAVCPLAATLSGTLLSEVPYTTLSLLLLTAARAHWARKDDGVWAFLGALAGFGALIRATGLVLPGALVLCLLAERRLRTAAVSAAAAALAALPYYARNLWLTGRADTRFDEMAAAALRAPLSNAAYYGRELFGRTLLRLDGLEWLFALICLPAVFIALRRRGLKGWSKLVPAYLGLYALVHLAWPYQSGRYVYPMIGLACMLLPRPLLALSVALSVLPTARAAQASLKGGSPMNTPPERAYAWLRENADRAAVLGADLDGRLYLWTGRKTAQLPRAAGAEALNSFVEAYGVDYVFLEPDAGFMRRGDSFDAAAPEQRRAALADKKRYELVFFDEREGTRIYRVKRPG